MSRRKERQRRRDADSVHATRPENPPHPAVLALSEKFGPPKINLRQAELLDGYGYNQGEYAQRPIAHNMPWHVSREDLDYYWSVFSFMSDEPGSLLFYLYPVALEFERDPALDASDGLLYVLDMNYSALQPLLREAEDAAAFAEGLNWMLTVGGPDGAAFWQCPNLIPLLTGEHAERVRLQAQRRA
ncbi:hypothetical protein [Alienimonas californiensis]|uniref:Uncharacterized protein n=1 Tax=Alienimonas californiensis TaxID=2527989 RepID=A0A517P3N2_9PLAN|nr:hypothetical protein [Alienimonas californiensis]QDT13981.1 hypothetical protein CA12_00490 [Alienimonas californiensis]